MLKMPLEKYILLSTSYFAPVQYYSKFILYQKVYIEQFENFIKQTYRNRCVISGANGPISLVVPVVKGRGTKILKISNDVNWQRNHWRTIFSAYNSSPYFEFYKDEILPFYKKKWKYLLDYNQAINKTICDLLEIENHSTLTENFEETQPGTLNFREFISPKISFKVDDNFKPVKYTQVFSEKLGFVPNQSILDLLFNEGPNSYTNLKDCIYRG